MAVRKRLVKQTLQTHKNLLQNLSKLTEEELDHCLREELRSDKPRGDVANRLHSRFTSVRRNRERKEIRATINKAKK